MGWLTDIGNVAVGAIERDREITKEDLAIRAENLQANRLILVDQKKKKYDKELDAYYEEKKKFDDTERMNSLFSEGAIDDRTYAGFALTQEIPGFDNLPDKTKEKMIADYKGKTFDYELTGSAEEINAKAANAITMINNQTSKEIKEAKGNSFLINQILGKKEKAEQDIYKAIEANLKAADAVKMTSTNTNKDNVGLDVKVDDGTGGLTAIFNHNEGKWLTQYNSAVVKSEYDGITTENKILDVVASGAVKGFNAAPFIKKNDQGEVTGWTQNGSGFSSFVSQTYKTLHDNLADKNAIVTSFNYNDTIGGANINSSKLIDNSLAVVNQRAKVYKLDDNSVFSAIPIGVINENNQFIVDGQVFNLDNKQMSAAMTLYDSYLEKTSLDNVKDKTNWIGNIPETAKINAWNALQINMNSNRNFVKDGRVTMFAHEFKKMLINELALELPIKPDSMKEVKADEMSKLDDKKEDGKVVTVDKKEKKEIENNKPIVKDNIIYFKTQEGDQEISFENLDESQINQLKVTSPEIYKQYEIWLNNKNLSIDSAKVSEDTFTTNTNKFKNMLLESEKEILSGNKKNKNIAKKKKNITEGG